MQLTLIGCGNMGTALAKSLSQTNELFLYDHHREKTELLAKAGYGKACNEIHDAVHTSEMIILAVKPQNLKRVGALIKCGLRENQVIVSLLAGTPLSTLRHYFPTPHLVRLMPNLAILHGEGILGLSADESVQMRIKEPLTKLFETLGKVYWIPEEKMDGLTALASSGPAFFFTMVEAMVDAGIAMGFTAKEALELICQMVQGSLTLLEKTKKHPGELKWQIASPQGTTIAGLKKLEEHALRGGIINTFLAAYAQGHALSSQTVKQE